MQKISREFSRNEALAGDWKATMTVTEPYDIVDISKKLHTKNSKANRKTLTAFAICAMFYEGTGTEFAFLAMFQNTTQSDISVVVLRLCVS